MEYGVELAGGRTMRIIQRNAWIVGALLGGAVIVVRAEEPTPAEVGGPAPSWRNLPGADGKRHSLDDLREFKAVVVVFFADHCPDCKNYLPRIQSLAERFEEMEVAVVLISVSTLPEDGLEHMRKTAERSRLRCAYLHDATQKIGRAFGATTTPEAFVLDGRRRLAYRGAWDDHWKADRVAVEYVKNAVEAVLEGRTPSPAVTEAEGCFIEYDKDAE
jgi:peroxiredoxin